MTENFDALRDDFPALTRDCREGAPVYFDNACVTLRPRQVIEAMNEYYSLHPSCHKRAVHRFGRLTTRQYDKARETVQKFIRARAPQEIVFTKNTTEAINLVAHSFPFRKGDVILTSDMEHNSNFLPWQVVSRKMGLKHCTFALSSDGTFDLNAFKAALTPGVRLVSVFHTSHVTGYSLPVEQIIGLSHDQGALVMIDGAQSVPHQEVDVQALAADFLVFSFHKLLGPSGMGCLYARRNLLEKMEPFLIGGETVDDVDARSFVLTKIPDRFEAGLQNYAGAMGVTAALQYLKKVGMPALRPHALRLNQCLTDGMLRLPKVRLLGPRDPELRSGIINFYIEGFDSGELSLILDQSAGIMARSGVHCCHSWYKKNRYPPTLRVSTYFYNTLAEAEHFVETVRKIVQYY